MLKKEILDIIACPKCRGDLLYERDSLKCRKCRLIFSVVDDIPNMIIEEAKKY